MPNLAFDSVQWINWAVSLDLVQKIRMELTMEPMIKMEPMMWKDFQMDEVIPMVPMIKMEPMMWKVLPTLPILLICLLLLLYRCRRRVQ